jgi:hypothetical protein
MHVGNPHNDYDAAAQKGGGLVSCDLLLPVCTQVDGNLVAKHQDGSPYCE